MPRTTESTEPLWRKQKKKTTLLPLWRCYSLQIEGKVKNGSPDFLKLIADVLPRRVSWGMLGRGGLLVQMEMR